MAASANNSTLSSNTAEIGRFLDKLASEYSPYQGPDRRDEPRRRMIVPVVALPYDNNREKSGTAFQTVTRDFSDDGIGLLTIRPVTTPQLGLLFQTQNGDEMMIVIEITRCRRVGVYYDVGGTFTGMLETSR